MMRTTDDSSGSGGSGTRGLGTDRPRGRWRRGRTARRHVRLLPHQRRQPSTGAQMDDQFFPDEPDRREARQGEAPLHARRRNRGVRTAPSPGDFSDGRPHQVLRGAAQAAPTRKSTNSRRRSVCYGDGKVGVPQYICVQAFKCDGGCPAGPARSEAVPAVAASQWRPRPGRRAQGRPGPALAAGPGLGRLSRRPKPTRRRRPRGCLTPSSRIWSPSPSCSWRAGLCRRSSEIPSSRTSRSTLRASRDYLELCRTTVSLLRRLAGRRFSSLDMTERIELMTRHRLNSTDVPPEDDLGPFADDTRAVRTRARRDLIADYYNSPAGWAVVGYDVFPGRCGDLGRYTRPES